MIRILLSSHTYTEPDYHTKLIHLAELQNIELCVVVPDKWSDALFDYANARSWGRYSLLKLPIVGPHRSNAFLYRADLPRLIQQFKPDILHIEQEPRSIVTTQWLFANRGRAKTIVFTWENIAQPRQIPQSCCQEYAFKHADGFICGNSESVQVLHAQGWRGATWVLPQMGVDPNWGAIASGARIRERFQLGNNFVVGFVGRLVIQKGINDLLAAISDLGQVRLFLVGNGEYGDQIKHSRTTISPQVPHAQIADYFAAMDVLVLPSRTTLRWKEQFGRVIIEAMACGVPVIGSDSGAIPEVIGDAGLIFPEGDINALKECLLRLLNDSALRAELAAKGRARVLAHYSHERIAQQTYSIYQELLSSR